jgi:hypothetical protein
MAAMAAATAVVTMVATVVAISVVVMVAAATFKRDAPHDNDCTVDQVTTHINRWLAKAEAIGHTFD